MELFGSRKIDLLTISVVKPTAFHEMTQFLQFFRGLKLWTPPRSLRGSQLKELIHKRVEAFHFDLERVLLGAMWWLFRPCNSLLTGAREHATQRAYE
jgi:hypothetical protein